PAANYKIGEYTIAWTNKDFALKAIRYERVLELGMEGHRFFDLVRWKIADTEIKTYLQKEKIKRTYLSDAIFKAGKNEYFPIPQIQIDLSAGADGIKKMIQNHGY
ncbi:MAG: RagB/SusD family nutrient uptake outer membrane protein, partial [Saprospiraceae bacterium]